MEHDSVMRAGCPQKIRRATRIILLLHIRPLAG
jgi:hypothetical protein